MIVLLVSCRFCTLPMLQRQDVNTQNTHRYREAFMATIKEIAALAGVSRGTVDRVLNNRGSVNPDTARKIQEIAKALD